MKALLSILLVLSLPSFASLPHPRTIERRPAEQPSRGQMRVDTIVNEQGQDEQWTWTTDYRGHRKLVIRRGGKVIRVFVFELPNLSTTEEERPMPPSGRKPRITSNPASGEQDAALYFAASRFVSRRRQTSGCCRTLNHGLGLLENTPRKTEFKGNVLSPTALNAKAEDVTAGRDRHSLQVTLVAPCASKASLVAWADCNPVVCRDRKKPSRNPETRAGRSIGFYSHSGGAKDIKK